MNDIDKLILQINVRINELKELNRHERFKCEFRQESICELEKIKFMLEDVKQTRDKEIGVDIDAI